MARRRLSLVILSHLTPLAASFSDVCVTKWGTQTSRPLLRQYPHVWGSSFSSGRPSSVRLFSLSTTENANRDSTDSGSSERGSWESGSNEDFEQSIGQDDNDDGDAASVSASADDDPLLNEYGRWKQAVNQSIKVQEKKEKSLRSEMQKASKIEETLSHAQLLTSYLYLFTRGVTTVTVQDWEQDGKHVELSLDPSYHSAADEADALFQQVRKLKRGSLVVGELLEATSRALESLHEIKVDLDSSYEENGMVNEDLFRLVQDRLTRSARTTNFSAPKDEEVTSSKNARPSASRSANKQGKPKVGTPASNLRKLTSPGGCTVLVGRNRRGNEDLTFQVAKGDDIWMHSRGCPGAHVLIQQRRGSVMVTDECIQFAADLACFYSDFRAERSAEVTAAKPKHLQKPRGAPLGTVKLREEWNVYTGYPDSVPDELKLAREESGQSEEYRSSDKAKHRKQTKQASSQQTAKQKAKARAKRSANK
jgi:hypothetical protein